MTLKEAVIYLLKKFEEWIGYSPDDEFWEYWQDE